MKRLASHAVMCGLWAIASIGCGEQPPSGTQGAQRESAAVSPGGPAPTGVRMPAQIKAHCVVQTQQSVKLKAELGGRIQAVQAELGQTVRTGSLLSRIQTDDQALELKRIGIAEAQSKERMALLAIQIQQARNTWEAVQSLYAPTGVATAKEALLIKEREAELKLTQLALEDLRLQRVNVERQLTKAELRSPMNGVVLARNAEVGMVIAPGAIGINGSDVLFEIGDPLKLRATCATRESDANRLTLGLPMQLRLDGGHAAPILMKISRIAPAIQNDAGASSLLFWGDFVRPADSSVLPGMHGNVAVELAPQPNPGASK